jgi:hypothetical protein
VEFCPRFILVNETEEKLFFKSMDKDENILIVNPKEEKHFHCWPLKRDERILFVKFADSDWSSGFFASELQDISINLIRNNKNYFLRIEPRQEYSTILLNFKKENKLYPPYKIENQSKYILLCGQKVIFFLFKYY